MRRAVTGHFPRVTIEIWDPGKSTWHPLLLASEVRIDRRETLHHHQADAAHDAPMKYVVHGEAEEVAHRGPIDLLRKELSEQWPDHHVRLLIRSRAGELHGTGPSYDLYSIPMEHWAFEESMPFLLTPETNTDPTRAPLGVGRYYSHYPDESTAIDL